MALHALLSARQPVHSAIRRCSCKWILCTAYRKSGSVLPGAHWLKATKQVANRPPFKPSVSDTPADQSAQSAAPTNALVAGSAPIMQANSFENRFSAMK